MWTLARILIALAIFWVKLRVRRKTGVEVRHGKRAYLYDEKKTKGTIREIALGAPFPSNAVFWLHREGGFDRLLKGLGLADEMQTGDRKFDREVYVVSDNPAVALCLQENPALRRQIVATLESGFDVIHADGHALWMRSKKVLEAKKPELDGLFAMATAFKALKPRKDPDSILFRVFVVEVLMAIMAGYGASVALDIYDDDPTLVFPDVAIFDGLAVSAALFAATFGLTVLLLRRSSRARWVLAESLVVLLVSALACGFGAIRDLNAAFDRSVAIDVERPVTGRRIVKGRKGKKRYYVSFPTATWKDEMLPTELKVSRSLYGDVEDGGTITFRIKEGSFGYPWYEDISASKPTSPRP